MVDPLDNLTSSEQLRRLLLQEEQERIDRLEARLGDEGALKTSIVPIIADVLQDAGVKDHKRLAGAIAPVVLQSIKTEIHNSRDMMVDALYPITGRLVAAAVRNAFKDMVDQLNQKLDSSLSADRWRAKFKAKITGKSEAEVLLSEGAAFEIIDFLLVNRQSGLLIARAGSGDDGDDASMDGHLLTSILTAIMAFVRDAMRDASEQDLRTLHVGDMRLHLQVSPGAILAVKTKGPPPAGFDTFLGETFYALLSRWGDRLSDPDRISDGDVQELSNDLEIEFESLLKAKQSKFQSSSKKGTVLLCALGLLMAGWIGWTLYDRWHGNNIEGLARSVIAGRSELIGYPIDVTYDRKEDVLKVSGLLPDQRSVVDLRDGFKKTLPNIPVSMNIGNLPDRDVDLSGIATTADLARVQTRARDEIKAAFDDRLSTLSANLDRIEQRLPTAVENELTVFRRWLGRQSLQFTDKSEFHDEVVADATLEDMVERLSGLPPGIGLRIVGYGDDLGERRVSARVSRERAALVASRLGELGVSAERLQVVGRGSEQRIGDADGPGSANRRVEFELTYLSGREFPGLTQGDRSDATR